MSERERRNPVEVISAHRATFELTAACVKGRCFAAQDVTLGPELGDFGNFWGLNNFCTMANRIFLSHNFAMIYPPNTSLMMGAHIKFGVAEDLDAKEVRGVRV